MPHPLNGKTVILGVCGGIAAYKSVSLLRLLQKESARVKVIMTASATKFVTPLTFGSISGFPVYTGLFDSKDDPAIQHIQWAKEADLVIVGPATANMIGKMAGGIGDDALSTFLLAVTCPIFICPAMNNHMYENRAVQRNLDRLEEDGFHLIEPGTGEMACGTTGVGRFPEPEVILDRVIAGLSPKDYRGKNVLISAGPTQEPLDPVRYISNHSSGKMGFALARGAEHRGAAVTLVKGPTHLPPPLNVTTVAVTTAQEMAEAIFNRMSAVDIIIKVAAVADYRPVTLATHKIKKNDDQMVIELTKNQDILAEIGRRKTHQKLIGFAAETQNLEEYAVKKLLNKNLDLIVGNIVGTPDSGFGVDSNQISLFFKSGQKETFPTLPKDQVAHVILDRILGTD